MNRRQRRTTAQQAKPGDATDLPGLIARAERHHATGQMVQAAELYEQALLLQPDLAEVRSRLAILTYNLGNAAARAGDLRTAEARFARAVTLQPALAVAHDNLVHSLVSAGRLGAALDAAIHGIDQVGTLKLKRELVRIVRDGRLESVPPRLPGLLVRAFAEGWSRAADLARAAAQVLRLDPTLARPGPPDAACLGRLAANALLLAHLEHAPVTDPGLEGALTAARLALLTLGGDDHLALRCALARQCFVNEYVFAVGPAESEAAGALQSTLSAALSAGTPIPPGLLATCAAYASLSAIPGAQALMERQWDPALGELVRQQVREPAEERRLRSSIPQLTAIRAGVSAAVREQYEENPYPRWVVANQVEATGLNEFIQRHFPLAPFRRLAGGGSPDILVAGCGTGQHPITTARRFANARILALDLSRASLGHAARKTAEAGQAGIEYAQADILELAGLPRRFDMVEASGVLHHLGDPFQGWQTLAALLKPGGLMRIGLYSARGREHVAAARTIVDAHGFQPTAEGIRAARQTLIGLPPGSLAGLVTQSADFFSLSACRDLIFHVQEHRLTLSDIAACMARLDLRLIGFDVGTIMRQRYAARFPVDAAGTDLALWDQFEAENPACFTGMYQFWAQRGH